MRYLSTLTVIVVLAGATRLATAGPAWTLTLSSDATAPKGVKVERSAGVADTMEVKEAVEVTIKCKPSLDCTKVALQLATLQAQVNAPVKGSAATEAVVFTVNPTTAKLHVLVEKAGGQKESVHEISLTQPADGSSGGDAGGTGANNATGGVTKVLVPVPVRDLLATACPKQLPQVTPYDQANDLAEVYVSANGVPMTAIPHGFDENDALRVVVYADIRLLPVLKVTRKSAFRDFIGTNILGDTIPIPQDLVQRHSATDARCDTRVFVLRDFAAGRAVVQITAASGETAIEIGEFDFSVRPLYSGMFSVGAVWTPLVDANFDVAMRAGQSVIVATEAGPRRMAYVFLYTPFLWDKLERDIRKPRKGWHEYVNPSVGFVLDDPLDNVLLGASVDFSAALVVTAGAYFSHVKRLDGVAVGDAFDGTADDLPVQRTWERDWFFGVTVDLRAATSVLRTVLGTATSGT